MTGSKLKAKANTTCLHAPNLILYPIGHFRVPREPLYQNKVKCSAFDKEMIFHSHANKTHFLKKGCALGLIFKVRVFGTRKWPVRHFGNEKGTGPS